MLLCGSTSMIPLCLSSGLLDLVRWVVETLILWVFSVIILTPAKYSVMTTSSLTTLSSVTTTSSLFSLFSLLPINFFNASLGNGLTNSSLSTASFSVDGGIFSLLLLFPGLISIKLSTSLSQESSNNLNSLDNIRLPDPGL